MKFPNLWAHFWVGGGGVVDGSKKCTYFMTKKALASPVTAGHDATHVLLLYQKYKIHVYDKNSLPQEEKICRKVKKKQKS